MKKKTYLVPAASAALTIALFGVTAFATAVPKDPGLQGGTEASTEAVSETAPAASSGNAGADLAIDQPDVLALLPPRKKQKPWLSNMQSLPTKMSPSSKAKRIPTTGLPSMKWISSMATWTAAMILTPTLEKF